MLAPVTPILKKLRQKLTFEASLNYLVRFRQRREGERATSKQKEVELQLKDISEIHDPN